MYFSVCRLYFSKNFLKGGQNLNGFSSHMLFNCDVTNWKSDHVQLKQVFCSFSVQKVFSSSYILTFPQKLTFVKLVQLCAQTVLSHSVLITRVCFNKKEMI